MECEEVRQNLMALYDGELPGDRKRDVEAHLASCAGCQQEWNEIQALGEIANAWPAETGTVWTAVQQEIQAEEFVAMRAEMARMRADLAALQTEVLELRGRLAAELARTTPSLRFPCPVPERAVRFLV